MKVIVIGSGLIGLTTAYCLNLRGHDVMVIDRQAGPARGASFANGALLVPSMSAPWNAPGCWRVLLASLVRPDAALQLRLGALPSLFVWGIAFLRNSRRALCECHARVNLQLASYSLELMRELSLHTSLEYGRSTRGTLRLFRHPAALNQAWAMADSSSSEGLRYQRLSREETIGLEPALAPIAEQLVGAVHCQSDEVGDAFQFCQALADRARLQGVQFRFHTQISSMEMHAGQISALRSGEESFIADRYIVAAGSFSARLLKQVGLRVPVQPAKGYSITFETRADHQPPRIALVDDRLHVGIVPLEGYLRVVGTAEFAGYDQSLDPARIRHLLRLLREILPKIPFDPATAQPWSGLRPMSADGVPIIGLTPIPNLLVNIGHGHLGWTMAVGSAQFLTALLSGDAPALDPAPFSLSRF